MKPPCRPIRALQPENGVPNDDIAASGIAAEIGIGGNFPCPFAPTRASGTASEPATRTKGSRQVSIKCIWHAVSASCNAPRATNENNEIGTEKRSPNGAVGARNRLSNVLEHTSNFRTLRAGHRRGDNLLSRKQRPPSDGREQRRRWP